MIGPVAFDPDSGAPLSEDRYYHPDFSGGRDVGAATPEPHPLAAWDGSREGALTNGELRSSGVGLTAYFRRMRSNAGLPAAIDSPAALAIKQLKATDAIDAFVWLAAAERLATNGHWSAWMLDHYVPRCPHCASRCKFDASKSPEPRCASAPNDHGHVGVDIRDRVGELYVAAFDEQYRAILLEDVYPPYHHSR